MITVHNQLPFLITGTAVDEDPGVSMRPKQNDVKYIDGNENMLITIDDHETSRFKLHPAQPNAQDQDSELFKTCNPAQNVTHSTTMVKDTTHLKHVPPIGQREAQPLFVLSNSRVEAVKDSRFIEGGQLVPGKLSADPSLDIEDFDIPWSALILKERIGAGIFQTSFKDKIIL